MRRRRALDFLGFGLALVLIPAASALAQEFTLAPTHITPSWFLRVELLSGGLDFCTSSYAQSEGRGYTMPAFSAVNVEAEWHRVRLGVGAARFFAEGFGVSMLPFSVGYTIWHRPYNYAGQLFGMVPEVYARFTGDWSIWGEGEQNEQAGTLELGAALDGFCAGLSASAGVTGIREAAYYPSDPAYGYYFQPFVGIRVRLLTLNAGF
jgi:hypothetical protein